MPTYFVDQTSGLDTNSGLTSGLPWKTVARVNTALTANTIVAGDTVQFKRGETWREQVNVNKGGAAGSMITFGYYGTGALPIINGSDVITGWDEQVVGSHMWRSAYSWVDPGSPSVATPQVMFLDGVRANLRSSTATCTAVGHWTYDGTYLWLYCLSDPDSAYTTIELATRNYGFYCSSGQWVTIQDVEIKQVNHKAICLNNLRKNYLIQRVTAHHNGALYSNGGADGAAGWSDKNTISADNQCDYVTVQDCTIYQAGGNGVNMVNGSHHIVRRNTIYDCDHHSIDLKGGSAAVGSEISHNWLYQAVQPGSTGMNLIVVGVDPGTASKTISGVLVHHNVCYGANGSGVLLSIYADNVMVFNNTIASCHYAISLLDTGTAVQTVRNNIFYLCDSDDSASGMVHVVSPTNKYFDFNCLYYVAGIRFYQVNAVNYTDWVTFHTDYPTWDVTGHSILTDPAFVNPAIRDYTLQAGSPAIDAGRGLGMSADYANRALIETTDLGAYAYNDDINVRLTEAFV